MLHTCRYSSAEERNLHKIEASGSNPLICIPQVGDDELSKDVAEPFVRKDMRRFMPI